MENRKDFDRDLEQLTTRQTPMTQEERDRVLALAWSKAGLEPPAPQPKAPPAHRAAKPLRTVAIAAAVCALAVTAFAAPALIRMAKGEIGFFRDAPGQSEVDKPCPSPTAAVATVGEISMWRCPTRRPPASPSHRSSRTSKAGKNATTQWRR